MVRNLILLLPLSIVMLSHPHWTGSPGRGELLGYPAWHEFEQRIHAWSESEVDPAPYPYYEWRIERKEGADHSSECPAGGDEEKGSYLVAFESAGVVVVVVVDEGDFLVVVVVAVIVDFDEGERREG